ncbi:MBL fold metallo-hydrolase [Haladaptatus sp. DYF46]|uniref:MBL fold metallo-hydrolase n=1 Tax=Haladaptatus sp. DYF46 TaxID=2886041 RepID=UPI001E3EDBE2|nr:MBL fold metallo-hydrolase [Haladaptatus sp. DYF46]
MLKPSPDIKIDTHVLTQPLGSALTCCLPVVLFGTVFDYLTEMSAEKVTDGIYKVQFEHVRVYILEDVPEGKTTLIDTGFDENGEELVETIRAEFGTIDRLILTHGDHGHHGGLPFVMEAFDPEFLAAENEAKLYEAIDYEPDHRFEDGDVLDGNIEVIQIPGHTKATSALLLRDRDILISGDALDGADRAGFPEGYLLPPPALFNDDHKAAEINLYDLLQYDFDTVLVFHGSNVFENPKQKLDDFLVEREWDPRPDN